LGHLRRSWKPQTISFLDLPQPVREQIRFLNYTFDLHFPHRDRIMRLTAGTDFGKILHSQGHDYKAQGSLTNSSSDLESGADTTHMDILASSLQSHFRTSSLECYINAASLCANNTVLPYDFYANANFVWPRFYNAKTCCFGSNRLPFLSRIID
jgi:hypothetical protein